MSALDEALELLKGAGPEYAGGLANHGPMAAEALAALSRDGDVVRWTDGYRKRLESPPRPSSRLRTRGQARDAFGSRARFADLALFFEEELRNAPWRTVVGEWCCELAPGFVAAATHGPIRVGHAVRSLSESDSPPRRLELARALGYWASQYVTLADRSERSSGLIPSQALAHVPMLPADRRGTTGFIVDRLRPLDSFPPFQGVADLVDTEGDPSAFLSDLAHGAAGLYLANVPRGASTITFIHGVTGPSAIRLLLPYLDRGTTRRLLRAAWQTVAAFAAVFSRGAPPPAPPGDRGVGTSVAAAHGKSLAPPPPPESAPSWDELIEGAVRNGDEHAIKLVEACRREELVLPQPSTLLRAAAADALTRL